MRRNFISRLTRQATPAMLFLLLPFGLLALAPKQQPQPLRPVKVLRSFNSATRLHAFTTEESGGGHLSASFQRESTVEGTPDSPFFYLAAEQYPGTEPLYRFRAADGSQRFVRTAEERSALRGLGLEEMAKPVFVYRQPVEGASEIVCLTNPDNKDLVYTTSKAEKAYLLGLGWKQQASLGYTQSTSSSGTGILWPTIVKLEEADLALLGSAAGDGSRLVFASTNDKIARLKAGTMLYAPVAINRDAKGNVFVRQGFMRRVTSVTAHGSGLIVETAQAKYKDLFHDIHLYMENRPAAFPKRNSGVLASSAALPQAAPTPPKGKSFDMLTDYREPDYLSHMAQSIRPNDTSASLEFTQSLNYNLGDDGANLVTVTGSLGAELTGEINVNAGCSDSIDLLFTSICDQYTVSGTVLFTPSAMASTTASVNVGGNFSLEEKVFEESETFEVEGIPVTVTFDIKVGASISDQATAVFSASALARATGGFSASLVVPEVWDSSGSLIGCPNPCPDGFSCGASDQGYPGYGSTCLVTANASQNINLNPSNVDAKVWVTPEISAGPGIDDLSASVSFSLQNALEFNISADAVNGTYELTPSVGFEAGLCVWGFNVGYSDSTNIATLDVPIFSGSMPSASTQPAASVVLGGATLTGMVTPSNLGTTAWFLYGTSPSLVGATQTAPQTCTGTSCYLVAALSGLTPGTDYYSELVAKNTLGTNMGGIVPFHIPTTQTITFPNPGTQTYGVAPILLKATSTSGLPIVYSTGTGSAAVSGNMLVITGTGPVTVLANQPGNADFTPAPQVSVTFQVNPEAGNFGSVAVGQKSTTVPVTLNVATGTQIGSVAVLTDGVAGKDYQGVVTSNNGTTIAVNVTFRPIAPGVRHGAVVVYDTSTPANVLTSVYLSGVGVGPEVVFGDNQTPAKLGTAINEPYGIALDGSGNVIVAEYPPPGDGYGQLEEIVASGGYKTVNTVLPVASGVLRPNGIAMDAVGNLFVADIRLHELLEIPAPGYTTATYLDASAKFSTPKGVAVDPKGNLFVADTGDNAIKEAMAVGGYVTVNTIATGFSSPSAVALDAAGNIYVADTGNNAVKEILAAGGYTKIQQLGSGFSAPNGVAVDAAGNVYVADTGNNAVKEILAAGGYTTVQTLGSGFSAPNAVAVDASGNVYVADTGHNAVKRLNLSSAPSLSFASASVNGTGLPLTLTVANDGNAPLTFPVAPAAPAGFSLADASTCAESGAGSLLISGASCTLIVGFSPAAQGSIAGSLVLTDNNLNAPAPKFATQTVKLSGKGLFPALLTASVTANDKTYDGTATASVSGCSLTGVLAADVGNVTCSVTSATFAGASAGNDQTVSAVVALTGTAASHYTLSNPTASTIANIAPATLTVTAESLMLPVGSAVPAATYSLSGFVDGQGTDVVTTAPVCSTTATSKSAQGSYPIVCSGAVAPNYSFNYVNGTLTLSLAAQFVVTQYQLGNGFSTVSGVALDSAGNVYLADSGSNSVEEILVGSGYSMVTLASGFSAPEGVAVDGNGNLYVADTGNNAVKEVLAAGGYKTVRTLGSGLLSPTAVAVDAKGNVFVADTGNNAVKEIVAASGYKTVNTLGSGFRAPAAVAVDPSGDVFVADTGNNAVKEIVAAGGYKTVNTLGGGFNQPAGVALDSNWNVYVTDTGNGVVKELAAPSYTSATTLGGGFTQARGLAIDTTGNVYVASGSSAPVQVIAYSPCFPTVPVGGTSLKYSYYFTFLVKGSIAAPAVLNQGAAGQEFADAGTGSCTKNGSSHVYNPGDDCTVDVVFSPKHPGARLGSVQLTNAKGGLVATALVSGTGSAPQIDFPSSNTPASIGSGFKKPNAVAVDGNGNVFVADTANSLVKEVLAAGGYTKVRTLGSGFSAPSGVAVDGDGNVYVADTGNQAVKEILAVGGYTKVNTLGGTYIQPTGVAVDGAGNVFVSDSGNSTVSEILWGGLVSRLSGSFSSPGGLAVDASGNVFVADTGSGSVKELVAAGGYTKVITLCTGFASPAGVAFEPSGNLLVADTLNNAVKEIQAAGGYTVVTTLKSGLNSPAGVVVDESGNVFVAVAGSNAAVELPLGKTSALSFPSTTVGKTSAVQTVTLENNGNANLLPIFVGTGGVPAVSKGFTIAGGTCAASIAKGKPWLLPGASCTIGVTFTPQQGQSGTVSGTLTVTDNNLNLNPATQSIVLSGTIAAP